MLTRQTLLEHRVNYDVQVGRTEQRSTYLRGPVHSALHHVPAFVALPMMCLVVPDLGNHAVVSRYVVATRRPLKAEHLRTSAVVKMRTLGVLTSYKA